MLLKVYFDDEGSDEAKSNAETIELFKPNQSQRLDDIFKRIQELPEAKERIKRKLVGENLLTSCYDSWSDILTEYVSCKNLCNTLALFDKETQ